MLFTSALSRQFPKLSKTHALLLSNQAIKRDMFSVIAQLYYGFFSSWEEKMAFYGKYSNVYLNYCKGTNTVYMVLGIKRLCKLRRFNIKEYNWQKLCKKQFIEALHFKELSSSFNLNFKSWFV